MRTILARWRRARADKRFAQGFDYAAGQLLRGRPAEELEVEADNPFDRNEFDDGMIYAIRGWRLLVPRA
jgi:hypothetical protein